MNSSPSYDDLTAWDDLNLLIPDPDIDDPSDPRKRSVLLLLPATFVTANSLSTGTPASSPQSSLRLVSQLPTSRRSSLLSSSVERSSSMNAPSSSASRQSSWPASSRWASTKLWTYFPY